MTRYQCLRKMGFGWFSSSFIAFGNFIQEVPEGTIVFMNVVIDYDALEGEDDD